MRRFAIALAAIGVAACSNTAPDESPSEAEALTVSVGSYTITGADGSRTMAVLNDNGTYTDTVNGVVSNTGTWENKADGSTCFTRAEESDSKPVCYTLSDPAEDGSFTATPDEGDPVRVKKI